VAERVVLPWQDAFEHARGLAGERGIPAALQTAPKPA
jgi:hypothetical protein